MSGEGKNNENTHEDDIIIESDSDNDETKSLLMVRNGRPAIRRCNAVDECTFTSTDIIDYVYNNKQDKIMLIVQQLASNDESTGGDGNQKLHENDANEILSNTKNGTINANDRPLSCPNVGRTMENLTVPSPFAVANNLQQNDKPNDNQLCGSTTEQNDCVDVTQTASGKCKQSSSIQICINTYIFISILIVVFMLSEILHCCQMI